MEESSPKIKSKSLCIFPAVAWLLLLTTTVLLSAISVQCVNGSVISWDWDNSTIGSTVAADDQEFLMDSQFGNVLAAGGRSVSSRALQRPPICNAKRYANCIGPGPDARPCDLKNRCSRNINYR